MGKARHFKFGIQIDTESTNTVLTNFVTDYAQRGYVQNHETSLFYGK